MRRLSIVMCQFGLFLCLCVTCGSVNKIVCISLFGSSNHYNGSESMYWDGVWSVRASQCERASVFSSCRYMCITSVSTYLSSSV